MYVKEKYEEYLNLIEEQAPQKYGKPGIYSISIGNILVYIGKSHNTKERIAAHLCAINEYSDKKNANKYVVLREAVKEKMQIHFDILYISDKEDEKSIEEDIGYQEGVFIRQYLPPLNYQIPKEKDWHKFTTNKNAKTVSLREIMGTTD